MVASNALNISQAGLQSFDGTSVFSGRTLTAGTGISITNGNGIAGDPVITATGGGGGSSIYFSAYLSAPTGNVTGDGSFYGPIIFDTALSNIGGGYNPATGVFTAPSTGLYSFQQVICFNGADPTVTGYITFWGGTISLRTFQLQPITGGGTQIFSASITIPMTIGDTLSVYVLASGSASKGVAIYGSTPTGFSTTTFFCGFKVA